MRIEHQKLLRSLVAAQVAVIEHADEDIGTNKARLALLVALQEAVKIAKKLD